MLALHAAIIALLDAAQAAAAAGTKGPWARLHDAPGSANPNCDCAQVWSEPCDWAVAFCDTQLRENDDLGQCNVPDRTGEGFTREQQMRNALCIALSRNALPPLLAYLREQADHHAYHAVQSSERGDDDTADYHLLQLRALAAVLLAAFATTLPQQCEAIRKALEDAK